jgi:holo-[acyl-carrier protein] synthase
MFGLKAGLSLYTGVDLVCVADVEASLQHFGPAYVQRLLSESERSALGSACTKSRRCALIFAGKEAALKALGLADQGVDWRDIEVNIQGMRILDVGLKGRASDLVAGNGRVRWHASGHVTAAYAMAVVVAD